MTLGPCIWYFVTNSQRSWSSLVSEISVHINSSTCAALMSQSVKFKKHRAICAQSWEKRSPNNIKYLKVEKKEAQTTSNTAIETMRQMKKGWYKRKDKMIRARCTSWTEFVWDYTLGRHLFKGMRHPIIRKNGRRDFL